MIKTESLKIIDKKTKSQQKLRPILTVTTTPNPFTNRKNSTGNSAIAVKFPRHNSIESQKSADNAEQSQNLGISAHLKQFFKKSTFSPSPEKGCRVDLNALTKRKVKRQNSQEITRNPLKAKPVDNDY